MSTRAANVRRTIWLMALGVVAGALSVPLVVGAAPGNPPLNVDVADWSVGVVPVSIHDMPAVSAEVTITNEPTVHAEQSGPWGVSVDNEPTVHAAQSGEWSVDIARMPNVHAVQSGDWGVEVTNEPGVQANQSGDWNVDVDSLPPVAIDGNANGVVVSNGPDNPVPVTVSQGVPTPVYIQENFTLHDDEDSEYKSTDQSIQLTLFEVPDDKWLVITSAEASFRARIVFTGSYTSYDLWRYGQGMYYTSFGLYNDSWQPVGDIDVDCQFRHSILEPLAGVDFENVYRGTRDCDVLVPPGGKVLFSTYVHNATASSGPVRGWCNFTGRLVDNP